MLQNGHTIFGSFRLYSSGRRVNFLILMLADQQQKCTLMHVMLHCALLRCYIIVPAAPKKHSSLSSQWSLLENQVMQVL